MGGPSVPLASLKWYITMVDIVVVRCYGDKLFFSLRGNPEGGRESSNNSHVPKRCGEFKSVSVCPGDKVDVYREKKSSRHVAMVAKFLDDNKPKRRLKCGFALFQTSSNLLNFIYFVKCWRNFQD